MSFHKRLIARRYFRFHFDKTRQRDKRTQPGIRSKSSGYLAIRRMTRPSTLPSDIPAQNRRHPGVVNPSDLQYAEHFENRLPVLTACARVSG
ncbi:hypothetical protein KCP78_18790 [Salmonella enterica subsp. enterica]|nr:hypothetical protein KCP78_18790 [Salmonella enterica subsp. enterica]